MPQKTKATTATTTTTTTTTTTKALPTICRVPDAVWARVDKPIAAYDPPKKTGRKRTGRAVGAGRDHPHRPDRGQGNELPKEP